MLRSLEAQDASSRAPADCLADSQMQGGHTVDAGDYAFEHRTMMDRFAALEQRLRDSENAHAQSISELQARLNMIEQRDIESNKASTSKVRQVHLGNDVPTAVESQLRTLVDEADGKILVDLEHAKSPSCREVAVVLPGNHDSEAGDTLVESVPLEDTVWDAAVLLGMQTGAERKWFVGRSTLVVIIFLLALNLLMQGTFLIAVPTTMSFKPYDEGTLESLKYERLFDGHNYDRINFAALQTRTAHLCDQNVHNRLAGTWEDVLLYLQLGSDSPPGAMICLLAMLIWILSMLTEIRRGMDVACAVWALPATSPHGVPNIIDEGDAGIFMVYATLRHKIVVSIFVFLPRFTVAFALMYFGIEYLADTPAVGELILNACALEVVKNIDELLFEAILTRRFAETVKTVQIRVPHRSTRLAAIFGPETDAIDKKQRPCKHVFLHMLMYTRIITVSVILMLGWILFLGPVQESTILAKDALCNHDREFTYVEHPSANLPIFATMSAEDNSTVPMQCFYMAKFEMLSIRAGMTPKFIKKNTTLEQLVNGSHPKCKGKKGVPNSSPVSCPETARVSDLASLKGLSQSDFFETPQCRDQDVLLAVLRETCLAGDFSSSYPALLHIFNGKRTMCSHFESFCKCTDNSRQCGPDSSLFKKASQTGITNEWLNVIRGVCPQTCGACQSASQEQVASKVVAIVDNIKSKKAPNSTAQKASKRATTP